MQSCAYHSIAQPNDVSPLPFGMIRVSVAGGMPISMAKSSEPRLMPTSRGSAPAISLAKSFSSARSAP